MNKYSIATLLAAALIVSACGKKDAGTEEAAAEQAACTPTVVADPQSVEIQAGLSSRILTAGCGDIEATTGQMATVHTTGWLFDETAEDNRGEKFWSSYDGDEPFEFQLGGRVIPGWNLGVPGMVEGEVRELTIAPDLGYGANGAGPIPPNSTLVFQIELLELQGSVVEAATE